MKRKGIKSELPSLLSFLFWPKATGSPALSLVSA
jgi:hypothetical protein